jgi:hypothetical protein
MFHKGVAVAVLVNGKVAQDIDQIVRLPFGTEYSLRIKNTHSTPAVVSVSIDGNDVLNGKKLRIAEDNLIDLERHFRDDESKGPRFKFIQMTEQIANHRGRKVDDGVVRVRWQYEKPLEWTYTYTDYRYYPPYPWIYVTPPQWSGKIYCSDNIKQPPTGGTGTTNATSASSCYCTSTNGFTTKGSESHQQFLDVCGGELASEVYEISFQIVGESAGKKVTEVITTRARRECEVCGTTNEPRAKFCNQCGTVLTV